MSGDGPQLESLKRSYPDVYFAGARTGPDLVSHFAAADVFVFPSRTDTFGMVLLEALACGTPVAAYPVMGPVDVIGNNEVGFLSEDLREACLKALDVPRERCRSIALEQSWSACTDQFLENIVRAQEAFEKGWSGQGSLTDRMARNSWADPQFGSRIGLLVHGVFLLMSACFLLKILTALFLLNW